MTNEHDDTRDEGKTLDDRARWPQLDPDAPPVPAGMRPKVGVEMGCGDRACADCYEYDSE